MSLSHKNLNPDAPIHQRVPRVHQAKVETPDRNFNTPFQHATSKTQRTPIDLAVILTDHSIVLRAFHWVKIPTSIRHHDQAFVNKNHQNLCFSAIKAVYCPFRTPKQEGVQAHPCPLHSPLRPESFKSIKKTAIQWQIRTLVPSNLVIRDILRSAFDPVIIQHYRRNRMVAPPS